MAENIVISGGQLVVINITSIFATISATQITKILMKKIESDMRELIPMPARICLGITSGIIVGQIIGYGCGCLYGYSTGYLYGITIGSISTLKFGLNNIPVNEISAKVLTNMFIIGRNTVALSSFLSGILGGISTGLNFY